MSKLIRVPEECESIIRKYSEGSLSDGVRAMEKLLTTVTPVTDVNIEKTIQEAIHKEMGRLRNDISEVNQEFMQFIGSGQGAVRVYKVP